MSFEKDVRNSRVFFFFFWFVFDLSYLLNIKQVCLPEVYNHPRPEQPERRNFSHLIDVKGFISVHCMRYQWTRANWHHGGKLS